MASGSGPSAAFYRQDGATESGGRERRFENTVPDHVPIKVRLKSEKSFKELSNKNWARELEVEVRNTGTKPIYYVYVVIVMPELIALGHPLSLRTAYGRKELGLPETPVEAGDVPILPGESVTLKFPETQVRGYEKWRDKEGKADPKRVRFEALIVKFGDGFYLLGPDGRLMHNEQRKRPSNAPDLKKDSEGCRPPEP